MCCGITQYAGRGYICITGLRYQSNTCILYHYVLEDCREKVVQVTENKTRHTDVVCKIWLLCLSPENSLYSTLTCITVARELGVDQIGEIT